MKFTRRCAPNDSPLVIGTDVDMVQPAVSRPAAASGVKQIAGHGVSARHRPAATAPRRPQHRHCPRAAVRGREHQERSGLLGPAVSIACEDLVLQTSIRKRPRSRVLWLVEQVAALSGISVLRNHTRAAALAACGRRSRPGQRSAGAGPWWNRAGCRRSRCARRKRRGDVRKRSPSIVSSCAFG